MKICIKLPNIVKRGSNMADLSRTHLFMTGIYAQFFLKRSRYCLGDIPVCFLKKRLK